MWLKIWVFCLLSFSPLHALATDSDDFAGGSGGIMIIGSSEARFCELNQGFVKTRLILAPEVFEMLKSKVMFGKVHFISIDGKLFFVALNRKLDTLFGLSFKGEMIEIRKDSESHDFEAQCLTEK